MTEAEANTQRDSNNNLLDPGSPLRWQTYRYFDGNFNEIYNVILTPDIYNVQYGAADQREQLAFVRVSFITSKTVLTPANEAAWVTQFQTDAGNDAILGPYLGLP